MQSCTIISKLRKFLKATTVEFAYAYFCLGVIKAAIPPDEVFSSLHIFYNDKHSYQRKRGMDDYTGEI